MKLKKKGIAKCLTTGLLSVAMAAGMLPGSMMSETVKAATNQTVDTADTEGLELSKSVKLQADGTYKINMEAYATGETEVITQQEAVPLDIVLVLDQSGSMSYNFGSGTTVTGYDVEYNSSKKIKDVELGTKWYHKVGDEYYQVTVSRTWNWENREYRYTMSYRKNGQTITLKSGVGGNTQIGVTLYEQKTQTIQKKRLDGLVDAADDFVDTVQSNGAANGVNHRIAIEGFASSGYNNTEILTGCSVSTNTSTNINNNNTKYYPDNKQYNGVQYNPGNSTYTNATKTALQDVSTSAGYQNVKNAIGYLTAHGGTQTDQGMAMAKDIIDNRTVTTYTDGAGKTQKRQTVVVLFTDGEPTGAGSSFSESVANSAISTSNTLKNNNTNKSLVFSVGIFDGANDGNVTNDTLPVNKFMHYVSSNYPSATSMTRPGNRAANSDFYKAAANAGELDQVFKSISTSISSSTSSVELDATAVLKDKISKYFDISGKNKVSAYTVSGTTTDGENYSWGTSKTYIADSNITLDGKTINVTGFDYKNEYISTGHAGKKLVVEATVTANELAAALGTNVPTNVGPAGDESNPKDANGNGTEGEGAGVYAPSTDVSGTTVYSPAEYFEVPLVNIQKNQYVLDFGKSVSIDKSEYTGINAFLGMNTDMRSHATSDITGSYGNTKLNPATGKVYKYTPTTFRWDGIDSVYGFGELTSDATEKTTYKQDYQWSQTQYIPATSVYYEDDFGTSSSSNDSSVKIIYTGSWSEEGTSSSSEQSYKSNSSTTQDTYGWDTVYSNGSDLSNGSAHKVVGQTSYKDNIVDGEHQSATAEFTFTGTGIDIYSRTNSNTGQALVEIFEVTKSGDTESVATAAKAMNLVDGLYKSGDLYQIPTVNFDFGKNGYGTYKAVITVLPGDDENLDSTEPSEYYLDGIRVYNPLNTNAVDSNGIQTDTAKTALKAYQKDGENNPFVVEFRDVLLNSEDAINGLENATEITGAVFIDELKATNTNNGQIELDTSGIKTFENWGPKNEVYLGNGQGVAFKVDQAKLEKLGTSNTKILVGMKAPEGATSVSINGKAPTELKSATDMYYIVEPDDDGNVFVQNKSANLLALTKIKVTNVSSSLNTSFIQTDNRLANCLAGYTEEGTNTASNETVKTYTGDVSVSSSGSTTKSATAIIDSGLWKSLTKSVQSFLEL